MYVQYVCTVCMYVFRYTHRMKSRIIALSFFAGWRLAFILVAPVLELFLPGLPGEKSSWTLSRQLRDLKGLTNDFEKYLVFKKGN